jgi:sulfur-oxidizing protein SoxZ
MTDPITLKLRQKDDRTEIEIQILHPMEPGDAFPQKSGSPRLPLFLQSMVIQLNEKTLVEGQLSASLSKNPGFGFSFSGIKAGDKFTVLCTDNKGAEFKSEIVAKS